MYTTDLVKLALRELGNASAEDLSSFIAKEHGVTIEPKCIRLFRVSFQQKQQLNGARKAAREAAERVKLWALAG